MYSVALHFQFSVNAIESKHVWAVSLVCIWAHLLTKYFICGVIWSFDVYWQLFVPQTWGPQPICFPFSRVYTRCCWEGLLVVRKFHQGGTTDSLASEAARLVPGIQVASHYKIKDFPTGTFEKHWNGYPFGLGLWKAFLVPRGLKHMEYWLIGFGELYVFDLQTPVEHGNFKWTIQRSKRVLRGTRYPNGTCKLNII